VKFNDIVWGVLLVVFAGVLFVHAHGFPTIPSQKVGPGVLPMALAVGLAVCGALLVLRGLRERNAGRDGAWVEMPAWFASRPQVLAIGVLVGVNLLYLLAADRLGFVITGAVYLWGLMAVLRVRASRAIPAALVMTLLIHYCFYKLLRVPLPWGVLQPVAW
jgi:putative tricarboxylic transport membrane protein